jgi:hypothetical protein
VRIAAGSFRRKAQKEDVINLMAWEIGDLRRAIAHAARNTKGAFHMRFAEFVRNSGSPVDYYPRLAIALGGVKEAVFVCQLLYWEGKQSDPQRWIHKSLEEVRAETGLSRYEQDGVRRTLESAGILESRYDRLVHRLYFRVDLGRLSDCWEAEYPSEERAEDTDSPSESGKTTFGKTEPKHLIYPANVEKPHSGMWKNHNGECGKTRFGNVEKPLSYNRSENTAENTTENTTTTRAQAQPSPEDSRVRKLSSSSLSLSFELANEYGLSKGQSHLVTEYCQSLGEEYVRSKAEIVRTQPRRNAAGPLLAALRDDWQPSVQPNPQAPDIQARLDASRAMALKMGWAW